MVVCRWHAKTLALVALTLVTLISYVAYNIYLIIVIRIERQETCEKLNSKYHNCPDDLLLINPKRAIFQDLLREWIAIAETNNISYVLSSGSLLGYYRNRDVIPWDIDVDVLVKDSSFSRLEEMTTPRDFKQGADNAYHFVVQPEYAVKTPSKMRRWNCNGQVVNGQPDHCSFIGPIARLIKGFDFVDIFGLKIDGRFAYEGYEKKYFRVDDLFPGKDCLFMEIKTKCPQNVKKILETFFHSIQPPCDCIDGMWEIAPWWKF